MMGRVLKPVPPQEWPALHNDMRQQNFPETPETFTETRPFLKKVNLFGVYVNNQRLATFILGPKEGDGAFLDVICVPGMEGRWASRPVLRDMATLAFESYGLRYVWIQTHTPAALKAALQAGFSIISGSAPGQPFLILTPDRLNLNRKEEEN